MKWWRRRDSNPRPPRCERGALPTELLPRNSRSRTFLAPFLGAVKTPAGSWARGFARERGCGPRVPHRERGCGPRAAPHAPAGGRATGVRGRRRGAPGRRSTRAPQRWRSRARTRSVSRAAVGPGAPGIGVAKSPPSRGPRLAAEARKRAAHLGSHRRLARQGTGRSPDDRVERGGLRTKVWRSGRARKRGDAEPDRRPPPPGPHAPADPAGRLWHAGAPPYARRRGSA